MLFQKKIISLQKDIYRSLILEVKKAKLLSKEISQSLRRYEISAQKDFKNFKKNFHYFEKQELIQKIQSSDVTLIADYHTFGQSQKTALSIIKEAIPPSSHWSIGLEMIPSHYQNILDDFQNKKISLKKFHQKIFYSTQWGFSWENYEPFFIWARENKIQLLALNKPNQVVYYSEENELQSRDQWSSGIIIDFFSKRKLSGLKTQMIVIYGELHVASKHLPQQLFVNSKKIFKSPFRCTTIHQNEEKIYWDYIKNNLDYKKYGTKISKDIYCIFSSTPWIKLQSWLHWVETENLVIENENPKDLKIDLSNDFENSNKDEIDYLSLIQNFGKKISNFFNLENLSYENLNIINANEVLIDDKFIREKDFTETEFSILNFYLKHRINTIFSKINSVFINTPSMDELTEIASLHIFREFFPKSFILIQNKENFYQSIIENTFSYLGSLIFNPERKHDPLQKYPFNKNSLKLTVDFFNSYEKFEKILEKTFCKKTYLSHITLIQTSQLIGQIQSNLLYQHCITKKIQTKSLQTLFFNKNSLFFDQEEKIKRFLKK